MPVRVGGFQRDYFQVVFDVFHRFAVNGVGLLGQQRTRQQRIESIVAGVNEADGAHDNVGLPLPRPLCGGAGKSDAEIKVAV